MAEVRKRIVEDTYNTSNIKVKAKKTKKEETKKVEKKIEKETEKKNLLVKFRIFCHGVKSEFEKIHWPSKKDMIKYLKNNYLKQLLENVDIKVLVKDAMLMNNVREQGERYLFTLQNSRLFN